MGGDSDLKWAILNQDVISEILTISVKEKIVVIKISSYNENINWLVTTSIKQKLIECGINYTKLNLHISKAINYSVKQRTTSLVKAES